MATEIAPETLMGEALVRAARGWIGTPYQHQASLKGVGCDCLGLLRGVWRELRGAEPETVPPYAPDWAGDGTETMREAFARHLRAVAPADLAQGDVALFRMAARGPARHCGIVAARAGKLTLIHARQNKQVSEELLSRFWRARLAGLFRL
jgi:NlpC/P60 family putative phage cell wall peptidase